MSSITLFVLLLSMGCTHWFFQKERFYTDNSTYYENLHKDTLVVALVSKNKQLEYYQRQMRNSEHSLIWREKYETLKKATEIYNQDLAEALKEHYTYSPFIFTYNHQIPSGEEEWVFYDADLKEASYSFTPDFIMYYSYNTPYSGKEMWIVSPYIKGIQRSVVMATAMDKTLKQRLLSPLTTQSYKAASDIVEEINYHLYR